MLAAGPAGFGFASGEVWGVHVAWSGNSSFRVERSPDLGATIGGGELLQPGEVVLEQGDDYTTPWVVFGASEEGLDGPDDGPETVTDSRVIMGGAPCSGWRWT